MTRRWPQTKHWQRLVKTFRETNGSRWRTAAAAMLGCEKRDLRALVDRTDMHPASIIELDNKLIDHLHNHVSELQERVDHICNVARSVMRARHEVSPYRDIETPVVFDEHEIIDESQPLTPIQQALERLMEDA